MQRALFLCLALAAGCAAPPSERPATTSSGDAEFARLADEYLAGHLAWRPQLGVSLGLHEYDGRITDFSPASLDAELTRLRAFDERLAQFPVNTLSRESGCDLRILQAAVHRELFDFEVMRSYTGNPMTYAGALDVNVYLKRDFAPLDHRVRSVIAILNQASNVMTAARANLANSLPRPYVETAIRVAEGSIEFLRTDLAAALTGLTNAPWPPPGDASQEEKHAAFTNRLKSIELRANLEGARHQAITELRAFVTRLKDIYLPSAHEECALGRHNFARMLREGELITLSPERILEIGQRELRREQQVFAETARKIDPAKQPIEVFKAIQREHPTEQSLLPDTKKNLEAIRQFLVERQLITLPSEVRPRVEETPAFARATSFASMDTPGPFETKATEAYYYVTPVEPGWTPQQKAEWLTAFNYYTTDVVSIHEAYPGHYVQALCLNASSASRLRKILGSYAFNEGWAHYTEQMMLDEGFGAGNPLVAAKYRLAQSDEALLRLCRLCVAIQMHCGGMTVDEATRFFMENCYYEEKPARQEAVRGTYDPGYLYYTLGKLMILKLRDDWRKQEGAAFTLKRFHDELLRHGQPPIRLLRELMLKNPKKWPDVL